MPQCSNHVVEWSSKTCVLSFSRSKTRVCVCNISLYAMLFIRHSLIAKSCFCRHTAAKIKSKLNEQRLFASKPSKRITWIMKNPFSLSDNSPTFNIVFISQCTLTMNWCNWAEFGECSTEAAFDSKYVFITIEFSAYTRARPFYNLLVHTFPCDLFLPSSWYAQPSAISWRAHTYTSRRFCCITGEYLHAC